MSGRYPRGVMDRAKDIRALAIELRAGTHMTLGQAIGIACTSYLVDVILRTKDDVCLAIDDHDVRTSP